MLSLTFFNHTFISSWKMFFFTLLSFSLFTFLGVWQIQRGIEKKSIVKQFKYEKNTNTFLNIEKGLPTSYQNITANGQPLSLTLLLDNQFYQHQLGYNVISILETKDKKVVLIDRGWVKAGIDRQTLPQVEKMEANTFVQGYAYFPKNKPWLLGDNFEKKLPDIAVIELVDLEFIEKWLNKPVYPFVLRLNSNDRYSFTANWSMIAMPAERHFGYAVQWFCFAIITWILFFALNRKK